MRISVLQPEIIRGDIGHNLKVIQRLIDSSIGELLILPEYALTGSLVLDKEANIKEWATRSEKAKASIKLPKGKNLITNSLVEIEENIFNCCELVPTDEKQLKLFPDETELESGVKAGIKQEVFELDNKKFKIIICTDLRHIDKISTEELDFIVFVFHFTDNNFSKAMGEVKEISSERKLPVIISSLVSDKNIGFSSYVNGNAVVSLPGYQGVLEIEI